MTSPAPYLTAASIPAWSPLVHPLPHHFRECTRVTLLVALDPGVTAGLLPEPLEPAGDFLFVSWLSMGEIDGHTDMHNISLNVPCRFEDKTGKVCSLEYIDSDMGLSAGRELLAYPKKDAEFVWDQVGDTITLTCSRRGQTLITSVIERGGGDGDIDWVRDFGAPALEDNSFLVRTFADRYGDEPVMAQVERASIRDFTVFSTEAATGSITFTEGPADRFPLGELSVLAARVDTQQFDLYANDIVGTRPLTPKGSAS